MSEPGTTKKALWFLVWLLDRTAWLVSKSIVWGGQMSLEELLAITRRPDQRVLHCIFNHALDVAMRINKRFDVRYYVYE